MSEGNVWYSVLLYLYILLDFSAWDIQYFLLCFLAFPRSNKIYASLYSITSLKKNVQLLMTNAIIQTTCGIKYNNDRIYFLTINLCPFSDWTKRICSYNRDNMTRKSSWINIFYIFVKVLISFYGLCGNLDTLGVGLVLICFD